MERVDLRQILPEQTCLTSTDVNVDKASKEPHDAKVSRAIDSIASSFDKVVFVMEGLDPSQEAFVRSAVTNRRQGGLSLWGTPHSNVSVLSTKEISRQMVSEGSMDQLDSPSDSMTLSALEMCAPRVAHSDGYGNTAITVSSTYLVRVVNGNTSQSSLPIENDCMNIQFTNSPVFQSVRTIDISTTEGQKELGDTGAFFRLPQAKAKELLEDVCKSE